MASQLETADTLCRIILRDIAQRIFFADSLDQDSLVRRMGQLVLGTKTKG